MHAGEIPQQCPYSQLAWPLDTHVHTTGQSRGLWGPEAGPRATLNLRLVLMTPTSAGEAAVVMVVGQRGGSKLESHSRAGWEAG